MNINRVELARMLDIPIVQLDRILVGYYSLIPKIITTKTYYNQDSILAIKKLIQYDKLTKKELITFLMAE